MVISQLVRKYAPKSDFDTFLKSIENPCLDPKYCPEIIQNRKNTSETYFQATRMKCESQKVKKSSMHILLAFFKLIFMPNSLIKPLRKKIHFFRIEFSTSIFQAYFGCAFSIPNNFRRIFWI